MSTTSDWISTSEQRRRRTILLEVAAVIGSVALFVRSPGQGSFSTLGWVAVGAVAGAYAIIAVLVRPRRTTEGTAYLALTPPGRFDRNGLSISNPDVTIPARLLVTDTEISWTVRGTRVRFPRDIIERVDVNRAGSMRPLGYLTLRVRGGGSVVSRVFQPGRIRRVLRAAGYAGS
jgi:hypothetical protein